MTIRAARDSWAESGGRPVRVPCHLPTSWPRASRGGLRDERAHPDQVVRRRRKGKDPLDARPASMSHLPQQRDGFHPAKRLLHQLALALTDDVARMAGVARIDRTAA